MNFNDHVRAVSNLSVQMPKFDVTRLSDFHEVLKNSVVTDSNLLSISLICENRAAGQYITELVKSKLKY